MNKTNTLQRNKRVRLPSDFSIEVVETRRQLHKIFRILEENILILENYIVTNFQVNGQRKIKPFSDI